MDEKRFLYTLQNFRDLSFDPQEEVKDDEEDINEYLQAMTLQELNEKVKDMVEEFRKQLKQKNEVIDKEKSALNQFISGLVKDEGQESPRKLKAMNFEDLNDRISDLITSQLSQNEKLHNERNTLQISLAQLQDKNTELSGTIKDQKLINERQLKQYDQQVLENKELIEEKQKLD